MPILVNLLAALSTLQADPRQGLLIADRAAASHSEREGFRKAVAQVAWDSVTLLYPGAPVLRTRTRITRFLEAQSELDSVTIQWQPLEALVAQDGSLGVTYGIATSSPRDAVGGRGLRLGRYVAAWVRRGEEWRLAALVQVGVYQSSGAGYRSELGPIEWKPLPPTGPAAAFIRADLDFAAMAGRQGAPRAFEQFAAPEAVTFGGGGELNRGPAAIGRALAGSRPAAWEWSPVIAVASGSGDLGFTVGQAVIAPPGGPAVYSKYLTIWQRQPNGSVRFLTDAGNSRPAP